MAHGSSASRLLTTKDETVALGYGGAAMPIRLIIKKDHAFTPEDAQLLIAAFEDTLKALRLVDREDPATKMVARTIVELAKQGERDPVRLREDALKAIRR